MKKINLALQGGGAHGAFAWGVVDYLLEDDRFEIDSISATSAGAMNAAAIADGIIAGGNEGARQKLFELWRSISEYGQYLSPVQISPWEAFLGIKADESLSYSMFDYITRMYSPYDFNPLNFNPLRDMLLQNINFEKIRNTNKIKLFVCATNVKTGKIKIFNNSEMSVDAVLASACIPFLFQAVTIKEESYWDGGYMGNPAIYPLIYDSNVADILIVHINPIFRDEVPHKAAAILNRINEISFNSSLLREMRAIAFVTKLLEKHWIKEEYRHEIKELNIHSIRSDDIMDKMSIASKFDTHWSFLTKLFELGRNRAQHWFEQNFEKIGVQSTIDFDEFIS